ncbi:hypothetical protein LTR05_007546 [Lithohypha guttulata]|uniref:nitric oxide dioxygenase n=1 Tax=Lithohypha guttulata TaxID=1690604 RepID=A0AAN7SW87_9EURO|nr:hypothetical protein LTR05_007546 [Lithohypha guttulata]
MSLTQEQKNIITATVPVVAEHGLTVTQTFYRKLLTDYPDLKNLFSHSAQITSHQASALAASVHAYAANINDLTPILPVVERINQKHASLNITPEQYDIVGTGLLAAFKEVLGDVFTDEVRDAWAAAYNQLAQIMIKREESIMSEHDSQAGGWRGWREMKIVRKVSESSEVMSFYLVPTDGKELPTFKPGQYVSVRVNVSGLGYKQCRQYSLSDAPPGYTAHGLANGVPQHNSHACDNNFRITVKRDAGVDLADHNARHHPGFVSNLLHNKYKEGDTIEITHPAGEFVLESNGVATNPVVLISAGVGITPVMSMLNSITASAADDRLISWIHVAKNKNVDPFVHDIKNIASQHKDLHCKVFHSTPLPGEHDGEDFDLKGRLDLSSVVNELYLKDNSTDYYICGPNPFMAECGRFLKEHDVQTGRIHMEVFGSGGYELLA